MIEHVYAMGAPPSGAEEPNLFVSLLPILIIFAIIYFLMIRPQSKRQKEKKQMIDSLKKGDKVITAGGIHGTIEGIREKENQLIIRVSKDVKLTFNRSSISNVLNNGESQGESG